MSKVIVIYSGRVSGGGPPAWFIVHFYNRPELLPVAKELYQKVLGRPTRPSANALVGPFTETEELDRYTFHLCQHLNLKEIGLLSLEKYNLIIEEVHNTTEFQKSLLCHCDTIENPDYKKKGLLSSLVS